jgi:hypothetical protein
MLPRASKPLRELAAEVNILHNAQVGGEGKFLVDDRDAGRTTAKGAFDAHGFAPDADFAGGIGPIGARQDLHQSRFAGAVLAH